MQKLTQKYTIVHLLEPLKEGDEYDYTDWPLHVTLADVFGINWDKSTLIRKFSELAKLSGAEAVVGDEARFGDDKQIRVRLIELNDALLRLHEEIIGFLQTATAKYNSPEYIMDGYTPHATYRAGSRLEKGDHLVIDTLTLIDMFPGEDPYKRKVLNTVTLTS